jgi:peptidyl-prolyl cis-trans isomerase C
MRCRRSGRRAHEGVTVLREPLFQFVVIGLLMAVAVHHWNAGDGRYTIHMGAAERRHIAASYRQQFGQAPTPAQLEELISRYVREEIFVREAQALHLDKNDEIVRRRMVQKYEFLQSDLAVPKIPGAEVLQTWFDQHKARYLTPERVAFTQIYFSIDSQGQEAAKSRASKVLARLRNTQVSRAPELGDAFPGPADAGDLAPADAARLFGRSELSERLFTLPAGQWAGPYRSGYGWHLVYVSRHSAPSLPPSSAIHERVMADYLEEQRRVLNERSFDALRAKYRVVNDGEAVDVGERR